VLDAAADLFGSAGYDATTTTQIAARAGVAVGSVYQFFPDKEALLDALADRHIGGIDEILVASKGLGEDAALSDIVAMIVEGIVAYARAQPFFGVLLAGAGSPPVAHASERLRAELAVRVEAIIAYKPIAAARRKVVAAVCVDLLAALLPRTLDRRGRRVPGMIRELELALGAYLAALTDRTTPAQAAAGSSGQSTPRPWRHRPGTGSRRGSARA
jgi:AcrR family transcriptional regulator